MAIFQKAYQGYSAPVSQPLAQWMQRTLVIFRYTLADVFRSRLFVAFFAACFLLPLVLLCGIYLFYNLELLVQMDIDLLELTAIDGSFFMITMQYPQNILLFIMVIAIGPTMISPDLRHNAMPLYLSRPISKANYILGKLLVLLLLGSLISWVPAVPLILFQAFLAGNGWLGANFSLLFVPIVISLIWIISLSLLSFAVSSWVKWKAVARLTVFGIILLGSILEEVVREIFVGWGGFILNIFAGLDVLMLQMYGVDSELFDWMADMPVQYALLQFLVLSATALLVLTRRIRAFQVVS